MSVTVFDALLVLVGVGLTVFAIRAAGGETIPASEVRVFRWVNSWPDWLFYVLWLPMQFGNLVVGALWGFGAAWATSNWDIAIATAAAVPLKLIIERVVRHRLAGLREVRQRPATSVPGAKRRGGDVPESGPSFPSGHVIMAATIGTVIAVDTWPTWSWAPALLIAAVAAGRVYVGAHNPLDVTCGLGIGLVAGGVLSALT